MVVKMIKLIISEQSLYLKMTLNKIIGEILEHRDEFNFASFDFETTALNDILDEASTPSFSSDKKVIVAKNPFFFKDTKFKTPFTNDYSLLEKYIIENDPNCLLIIVCPQKYRNEKNKLVTLIKNHGEIINLLFEKQEELSAYAKAIIKNSNIEMDSPTFELFIKRCKSVTAVENELAKLSLYNTKITKEEVERLIAPPLEDNVFDLTNAILKKDTQLTMSIYSDLKKLKIEPIVLISLLASQFRLMLQIIVLKKENYSDKEMEQLLNIHPYRIKIAKENSRKYSMKQIKQILIDLANLDYSIKKGTKDRYIDFEIFLATVSC